MTKDRAVLRLEAVAAGAKLLADDVKAGNLWDVRSYQDRLGELSRALAEAAAYRG